MHDINRLLVEASLAAGNGGDVTLGLYTHGIPLGPRPYVLAYTDKPRPEQGEWGSPGIYVSCPYGSDKATRVAVFGDSPDADPEALLADLIAFLTAAPARTIIEEVVL